MTAAAPAAPQSREIRIAPRGELCADTIDGLRIALHDAAQHGDDIVVDLAEVTLLSAAAVGLLVQVPNVTVVNANPLALEVLEVCGLQRLLRD